MEKDLTVMLENVPRIVQRIDLKQLFLVCILIDIFELEILSNVYLYMYIIFVLFT